MSLKQFLSLMIVGTLMAWTAWVMILIYVSPNEAGGLNFLFFYLSLLVALAGTFSIVGLFIRVWVIRQDDLISHQVIRSLRQAALFGGLLTGLLFLSSQSLLNLWTTLLLIIGLTVLEFFFISYKKTSL